MNSNVDERHAASAKEVREPPALLAIEHEPAAQLIVDPPPAEPLARGAIFIQYRTQNLRIVPVFGQAALGVAPRIGHAHIPVDDAPWDIIDASEETVVVVGLAPGSHKVPFELAGSIARGHRKKDRVLHHSECHRSES